MTNGQELLVAFVVAASVATMLEERDISAYDPVLRSQPTQNTRYAA